MRRRPPRPRPTRDRILQVLEELRVCTKTELLEAVGCGWGTISHHVYQLERRDGLRHRILLGQHWLLATDVDEEEWCFHVSTQHPVRQGILEAIDALGPMALEDLAERLATSRAIIQRHARILRRLGWLEPDRLHPERLALVTQIQSSCKTA